ncbi:YegP family protein [Nocardia sp. MW-W600-9]
MAGKFEIFADAAGKFRWRLEAGNGEIIAQSQAYESKEAAKKGISLGLQWTRGERAHRCWAWIPHVA